jgi:hypothetical protein
MNPLWTLAPVSVLAGAGMMWVFRRIANREAIRTAAHRIQAHLLEFWLFVDEPRLVGKFWFDLLSANARLLRLLFLPLVVLAIPMAALFFCLDSYYGSSPLAIGKPAVVTIGMNADRLPDRAVLAAPEGISIESPPVRVLSAREVSWRIRPERPVSGKLQCTAGGETVEKSVQAGPGFAYVSRKRTQSPFDLIRHPTETPLQAGPVAWVEVSYPAGDVALCGMEMHWSVWFIGLSLVGAVLLRK